MTNQFVEYLQKKRILALIGRNGRGLEHDPFRLGSSSLFIQFVYHLTQCFYIHPITFVTVYVKSLSPMTLTVLIKKAAPH